ncbi:MAG: type II toxin-antitoxin system HicB family antitoxin [bacterium]|nr:type II toxin-antitoxin system HicB family antitoxin [bacterium]
MQRTINAVIRRGESFGYYAECLELPVVTQGNTLDETVSNLQEAVALAIEGEDLSEYGLSNDPTVVVSYELEPIRAAS